MELKFIKEVFDLLEQFQNSNPKSNNISAFKKWCAGNNITINPYWEGKENGRSAESILATLLVNMSHFAKNYFRAVLLNSVFATQDEVIYLIVLRFNSPLTKMDLVRKNFNEKSVGIKIIDRLIQKGWVKQKSSDLDKRSKVIHITNNGIIELDKLMDKVRKASTIVSANLSDDEKMQLISLLQKLHDFHKPIYDRNFELSELLEGALSKLN